MTINPLHQFNTTGFMQNKPIGAAPDDGAAAVIDTKDSVVAGLGLKPEEVDFKKVAQAMFSKLPPRVEWKYTADKDPSMTSPSVSHNGKHIYLTDHKNVYSVSKNGHLEWKKPLEKDCYKQPTPGPDGSVYMPDTHTLRAFNEDGSVKWNIDMKSNYASGVAVAPDGTVYICTDDHKLHAYNPKDGSLKWEKELKFTASSTPTVDPDGGLALIDNQNCIYRFDKDGNLKWDKQFPEFEGRRNVRLESAPSIGRDGSIYVAEKYGILHAFNADGSDKFHKKLSRSELRDAPVEGVDGTLYQAFLGDKAIVALDPVKGDEKWRFDLDDLADAPAVVGPDGNLYIAGYDGTFHAVNYQDGKELWQEKFEERFTEPPVVTADGSIYVNNLDGNTYSLRTTKKLTEAFKKDEPSPAATNPDGTPAKPAPEEGTVVRGETEVSIDGAILKKKKKKI